MGAARAAAAKREAPKNFMAVIEVVTEDMTSTYFKGWEAAAGVRQLWKSR